MKRIGNFLFVEQWFNDHEPEQAVININAIECIAANELNDYRQHTMIDTNSARMALTGNHDDNIIQLAELLEKPITINQTFETFGDINLTFDDEEDNL